MTPVLWVCLVLDGISILISLGCLIYVIVVSITAGCSTHIDKKYLNDRRKFKMVRVVEIDKEEKPASKDEADDNNLI